MMWGSRVILRDALVLILVSCGAMGIVDDCSKNTYNTSESFMQFTKEPTVEEFAIAGKFKGLHCCAKGYRSIEWMKDGKQYPWASSTSGLILYPESANQTIYAQTITADDAGNYTCHIRNDTSLYSHSIQLKVFDKAPDLPKITYLSDDKEVSVGHSVRLFCEAFVGVVDLPDAHSEAIWTKNSYNGSLDDEPRIRQEKVSREDGQTFGTYLIIEDVTTDDFGKYICKISKPGRAVDLPVYIREKVHVEYLDPNPVPWKKMILWSSVFIALLVTLLILNMKYGLKMRVRFKDRFGTIEDEDGKANDVLVAYSYQDSEFVLHTLLPTLESRYGYKCATRELPCNITTWSNNFMDVSRKSRRLLAVLSPSSVNNQWDTPTIYQALKQLNTLNIHLTCVALQEIPKNGSEVKNSAGETLASILRTVSVVRWNREEEDQFWLQLRLRLPSKRPPQAEAVPDTVGMTLAIQSTRLNPDTQDNLDDFV